MQIDARVALIVMPFFSVTRASLGASLLKAEVERAGCKCDIHYFNIALAEEIGLPDFAWIGELSPPAALVGDWLFSPWAHGDAGRPESTVAVADYLSDVLLGRFASQFTPADALRLMNIRDGLGAYLDRCLSSHDWGAYRVIGFTTTFNQNCASIALAHMIKRRHAETCIIFGGANCEGDMGPGLLASYDCIDAVCSGEGEQSFATFVRDVLERGVVRSTGRIAARSADTEPVRVPAIRLDDLPYPEFGEYYSCLARSSLSGQFEPLVPFETSRGCWWGEKHHCTFCGLNGLSMKFRSKSQDRALAELESLSARWGRTILCVDNILDLDYFDEFLPRLAQRQLGLNLHYEVKVNLTKAQLHLLSAAGVTAIQPGIESFVDPVLRLMNKGSSQLQNIQLMRWCRELGIQVAWNVLYGFPGEDATDYATMIELLPRLAHLDPPQHCGQVRADRHSPYFSQPENYGVRLLIEPAYASVYPIGAAAVQRIAYYFDMDFREKRQIAQYEAALQVAVGKWCERAAADARFELSREAAGFVLCDSRREGISGRESVSDEEAAVLTACDAIVGVDRIAALPIWAGRAEPMATHDVVDGLVARGWLLRQGRKLLSLPVLPAYCTPSDTRTPDDRASEMMPEAALQI
jgi:ribosomal peptide maturation radical SAM protein 1